MPEPRDPLLKVLTYLLVFSERPLKYRIVFGAPAGTPREGGSGPREGPPAEATLTGTFTMVLGVFLELCNDPSAGSPTETLLRLLLPLNDRVWITFRP